MGSKRIVVIGSGAAGLAAATGAAAGGADVVVVDRAERAGGTTALSGGVAWLPATREGDSVDEAMRYLTALGLGDHNAELCRTFVESAAGVASALESATRLRWDPLDHPDYHAEFPGGRQGHRSYEPRPIAVAADVAALIRPAPTVSAPITYAELVSGEFDRAAVQQRDRDGVLTLGRALIASLLESLLAGGVELRLGVRATRLLREDGRVIGVTTQDGEDIAGTVILASGGFERDPELVRAFLRGPMLAPAGVPTNEGDGLTMALGCGAALGNMSEAWWAPAIQIPGEEIDGADLFRVILHERARPGSIIVGGDGRRFVDEAQNYNDLGRSLHAFDAATFSFPRVPAWLLFDGAYRKRYSIGPLRRSAPDPDWLIRASTVAELGEAIGASSATLVETIDRFNADADAGRDLAFGRGDFAFDRVLGDSRAPHPVLAALREPPFFALRLVPGCLATKGGPRTDALGRVLSAESGEPLAGLFAAGNVAASPFGYAYPGGGGTIGPALVFGYRAGEAAARESDTQEMPSAAATTVG